MKLIWKLPFDDKLILWYQHYAKRKSLKFNVIFKYVLKFLKMTNIFLLVPEVREA